MYLEIKNITKVIDGTKVLDSITLSMERGKIYGLRGRNGSGKTMIMKAICGLIRVKEGEIWIDGELLGKKYDFPKSIGALIETPGFVENYSGYSNLKMLADMKGFIGKKEIEMIMERVGLDPKEKKKVKKYSLGMRQKLGIAAALMEHPELIVLDEPINALDEESVQVLHCRVKQKKKRGLIRILSIIVIVCAIIPVIKVNQRYPEPKKVMIEKGIKGKQKEGLSLTIRETKWLNRKELEENYANTLTMLEKRDYKAVFVKAILKNETEQEQKFFVYNLYLESDIYFYNGLDMELYTAIEGNPAAEIILKPKEEILMTLPYSVSDLYFEKNQWETLEENLFYLVEERYPEKICWEI